MNAKLSECNRLRARRVLRVRWRGLALAWVLAMYCPWVAGAGAVGNPVAGQTKAQACIGCHGADGNGPTPSFPRLAGQYADYLVKALQDYRSGDRRNAIMQGIAAGLSDDDIRDLAAFYARQDGLYTVNILR